MASSSEEMKVVVFGATGVIGTNLIQYLVAEHPSWKIDAISRSGSCCSSSSSSSSSNDGNSKPSRLEQMKLANVTLAKGNPFDQQDVLKATSSCHIVFCCIGFHKYERKYWSDHWPIIVNNMLYAVTDKQGEAKKKLVFCDNLYAYGSPGIAISTETPPVKASHQSKSTIRALMRKQFLQHMKDYPGTLTVVGGADFFGPHVTETSFLGDVVLGKLVRKEAALAIGSADRIHDFCYAPDFARALAIASIHENAYDHFWICPHTIHGKSIRQIANDAVAIIDPDNNTTTSPTAAKITVLSPWMVYLLSPFMGSMWEMIEMLPLWTKDYRIDDGAFSKTFHMQATKYGEALEATVEFFQQRKQKPPSH